MKNYKLIKPERRLLLVAIVAFCVVLTASIDVVQAASSSTVVPVISGANNSNKYVAGNVYSGGYSSKALYYRHNKKQPWMRWSKSDNYQQDVICTAALASLDTTGVWIGNLGRGGVCGTTAEPATFAIGNYLNQNI